MATDPEPTRTGHLIPGTALSYEEAINATNDCIFIHDETGAIAYVNRATEELYGYTLEEFRRLGPDTLSANVAPYSTNEALANVAKAVTEGACVFPWVARRHNGELFWTEVSLRATKAGGRQWIIAVVRDIEKQHRADTALRESEDRLTRVFNASSNSMAITTLDTGVILDVNRTWEDMTGIARDAAVGRTATELGLWESPRDREICREALLTQGRVRDFEATLHTANGSRLFQLSAETFPLGDTHAALWELTDIDERRQLESQLFQAQKLESVGRLAGGVAHDFNNMLGVILGHVELLMMDFAPTDPRRASLAAVRHAAERSADLTRQLLAFARQQRIAPTVLDLNHAVESMLKMLRRLIGEDIELVWRPAANVCHVLVDPVQIDQVLANLCVNARDAIGGVGRVAIETAQVSIDEPTALRHGAGPGGYARLSIRDTGTGISPEVLSKIFEPFFTTKPLGLGTGLGLSTVHGIVLQNQGFITVESELGQGTTFHIHLPKTDVLPEAKTDSASEPQLVGHGERVLVVEDETSLLAMMRTMLGLVGFAVISASTPQQALTIAADPSIAFDVVVSDVIMPQMNGRELIANIRRFRPAMKCLFVSGYTADVLAEHGVDGDSDDFLAKPFSRSSLATRLRRLLDQT